MCVKCVFLCLIGLALLLPGLAHADWKATPGKIMSRWAQDVDPKNPLPEYPRPQMRRGEWQNLNGLWQYAIRHKRKDAPDMYDGQILVPYPIESALSGVTREVEKRNRLWHRREFELNREWRDQRILLHFGAVDWQSEVWVNGQKVGEHKGGYDPFSFDITAALKDTPIQEIVVAVWDPTDAGYQPRGKQVNKPEGIWYTSVTGIWQTVWLEPVPQTAIDTIRITPDIDAKLLRLSANVVNAQPGDTLVATAYDGDTQVAQVAGAVTDTVALSIENPKLWSPDTPFLYDLKVSVQRDGDAIDNIESYFGMRKIALQKDAQGINRLFLNNAPLFQYGPLDQGWWPDGLYTAPTDEALRYDVEITRQMGFNMARKHVKVEPARWYYHCDQLGLLVWQDMPNGDKHISPDEPDIKRSDDSKAQYYQELQALIDNLYNAPCIVMWVPFNEGWGQFDTQEVTDWTTKYDPTRLINQTSGWSDRGGSHVHDLHCYPGPDMFPVEEKRASILGEFGGLGLPLEGHLWRDNENWGYRTYHEKDVLSQNYETLIHNLRSLVDKGLAAAVYTQTTDVEGEVNGLLTYDRAIVKVDLDWLSKLNRSVLAPPPTIITLAPTSQEEGQSWRYTLEQPAEGWTSCVYDDTAWKEGKGMFGTDKTPNTTIRTPWESEAIWLRRTFNVPEGIPAESLNLKIHHDEDVEVYLNGVPAAQCSKYTTDFQIVAISPQARQALRPGENTLAVHCTQQQGGQCIDVGVLSYQEKE